MKKEVSISADYCLDKNSEDMWMLVVVLHIALKNKLLDTDKTPKNYRSKNTAECRISVTYNLGSFNLQYQNEPSFAQSIDFFRKYSREYN